MALDRLEEAFRRMDIMEKTLENLKREFGPEMVAKLEKAGISPDEFLSAVSQIREIQAMDLEQLLHLLQESGADVNMLLMGESNGK